MKQVTLNIPDNKYRDFINHIRNKFSDILIEEKQSDSIEVAEEDNPYATMLLSEKSLAEDWLSEEDNRWDDVL
ncbi:MAG: hypothetical protein R6U64_02510 [Bacteroidales bacterium]